MRSKEKLKKFVQEAANKMMEISGHEVIYDDLVSQSKKSIPWYDKYTITQEQQDQFEEWFIPTAMKQLGWSKKQTENEFSWFLLDYGLKVDYDME